MAIMGHGVLNSGSCAQGEGEKEWGSSLFCLFPPCHFSFAHRFASLARALTLAAVLSTLIFGYPLLSVEGDLHAFPRRRDDLRRLFLVM
jgi:hypothetical protein